MHESAQTARLRSVGLTARQRECLALQAYNGLSLRKIGQTLGLHWTTVQQHVAAARQKLSAAGLKLRCLTRTDDAVLIRMDPATLDRIAS